MPSASAVKIVSLCSVLLTVVFVMVLRARLHSQQFFTPLSRENTKRSVSLLAGIYGVAVMVMVKSLI